MIVDETAIEGVYPERADVCIIGTGPAGMTLAHSLVQKGHRVLLVEAGSFDWEDWSQDAYRGRVVGDAYYPLDEARLRYFGGTSNHWAGWCRPLTPGDYAPRAAQHAAWPIGAEALTPYNDAASGILEIEPGFVTTELSEDLVHGLFRYSTVNFGIKYREFCETDENVRLFLNSMVTGMTFEGDRVTRATVTRRDGSSYALEADYFALCTGGIENSRILKYINERNGARLRCSDVIGRYWMEHPHIDLGEAIVFEDHQKLFGEPREVFVMYLSDAARERMGLLNAGILVAPQAYADGWKKMVGDILCVAPALGRRIMAMADRDLVCGTWLRTEYEQAPIAENRVDLDPQDVDQFGVPRPVLHWVRTEQDRRTIIDNITFVAEEFARLDLGRIRLADWVVDDAPFPETNRMGGWHHMGGTRMGTSPTDSVVDATLKLHDLDNFYIGGSSVFPSGGYANPTYTIVKLALRLSDHLSGRMA